MMKNMMMKSTIAKSLMMILLLLVALSACASVVHPKATSAVRGQQLDGTSSFLRRRSLKHNGDVDVSVSKDDNFEVTSAKKGTKKSTPSKPGKSGRALKRQDDESGVSTINEDIQTTMSKKIKKKSKSASKSGRGLKGEGSDLDVSTSDDGIQAAVSKKSKNKSKFASRSGQGLKGEGNDSDVRTSDEDIQTTVSKKSKSKSTSKNVRALKHHNGDDESASISLDDDDDDDDVSLDLSENVETTTKKSKAKSKKGKSKSTSRRTLKNHSYEDDNDESESISMDNDVETTTKKSKKKSKSISRRDLKHHNDNDDDTVYTKSLSKKGSSKSTSMSMMSMSMSKRTSKSTSKMSMTSKSKMSMKPMCSGKSKSMTSKSKMSMKSMHRSCDSSTDSTDIPSSPPFTEEPTSAPTTVPSDAPSISLRLLPLTAAPTAEVSSTDSLSVGPTAQAAATGAPTDASSSSQSYLVSSLPPSVFTMSPTTFSEQLINEETAHPSETEDPGTMSPSTSSSDTMEPTLFATFNGSIESSDAVINATLAPSEEDSFFGTDSSTVASILEEPNLSIVESRIMLRFAEGMSEILGPSREEVDGFVRQMNEFYAEVLSAVFTNFVAFATNVDGTIVYEVSGSSYMLIDFDAYAVFNDMSAVPSELDVSNIMLFSDYDKFLEDYVWAGTTGVFLATTQAEYIPRA